MRLLVLNGSPRGKKSNSRFLMESFLDGYKTINQDYEEVYLRSESRFEEFRDRLLVSDLAVFVFPLYADSMPSIVLKFMQKLSADGCDLSSIKVLYFVHSGFPEPHQSRSIEKILERMSHKLGFIYTGCLIKGGSEGMQIQPRWVVKKTRQTLEKIGEGFAIDGIPNPILVRQLAGKEKMGMVSKFVMKRIFGKSHPYWDYILKKNGAYEQRFARPCDPAGA